MAEHPNKEHHIKCDPEWFTEVWEALKTFEYRKLDRDYEVGDTLFLYEHNRENSEFSGRRIKARVRSIYLVLNEKSEKHAIMSLGHYPENGTIAWPATEYNKRNLLRR